MVDANDVWIYVYEKGEARYTDLIRAFVDTGKRSKTVLLSYKKQLEIAGKIAKKISDKTNRPVYYVPRDQIPHVEVLLDKREIKKKIDQVGPEEIRKLKKAFNAAWNILVNKKVGETPSERLNQMTFQALEREVAKEIKREERRIRDEKKG